MTLKKVPLIPIWPTLVTVGNLICGFLAVCYIADGINRPADKDTLWLWASWLILAGMVFDALDGRVARLTGMSSDFGKELDSICDVVSFGLAPAFLMKMLSDELMGYFDYTRPRYTFILSMAYLAFAALRLARFNVETTHDVEDHRYFRGLPSPGAAGCVATMSILYFYLKDIFGDGTPLETAPTWLNMTFAVLVPLIGFMAGILMISRIRYVHVANIYLGGNKPFIQLVLTVMFFLGIILLIFYTEGAALALAFNGYMIAGVVIALKRRVFKKKAAKGDNEKETESLDEEDEEPLFE